MVSRWSSDDYPGYLANTMCGETFDEVKADDGNTELYFMRNGEKIYGLGHINDCCEAVWLEDINGDLDDLVGSPITRFDEITEEGDYDENSYESTTWTFYHIATAKGTVVLRWCGESNGYYSESVDFFDYQDPNCRYY